MRPPCATVDRTGRCVGNFYSCAMRMEVPARFFRASPDRFLPGTVVALAACSLRITWHNRCLLRRLLVETFDDGRCDGVQSNEARRNRGFKLHNNRQPGGADRRHGHQFRRSDRGLRRRARFSVERCECLDSRRRRVSAHVDGAHEQAYQLGLPVGVRLLEDVRQVSADREETQSQCGRRLSW
jgi:hypothetical protein